MEGEHTCTHITSCGAPRQMLWSKPQGHSQYQERTASKWMKQAHVYIPTEPDDQTMWHDHNDLSAEIWLKQRVWHSCLLHFRTSLRDTHPTIKKTRVPGVNKNWSVRRTLISDWAASHLSTDWLQGKEPIALGLELSQQHKHKEPRVHCFFQHCTILLLASTPNKVGQGRKSWWCHMLTVIYLEPT